MVGYIPLVRKEFEFPNNDSGRRTEIVFVDGFKLARVTRSARDQSTYSDESCSGPELTFLFFALELRNLLQLRHGQIPSSHDGSCREPK